MEESSEHLLSCSGFSRTQNRQLPFRRSAYQRYLLGHDSTVGDHAVIAKPRQIHRGMAGYDEQGAPCPNDILILQHLVLHHDPVHSGAVGTAQILDVRYAASIQMETAVDPGNRWVINANARGTRNLTPDLQPVHQRATAVRGCPFKGHRIYLAKIELAAVLDPCWRQNLRGTHNCLPYWNTHHRNWYHTHGPERKAIRAGSPAEGWPFSLLIQP